MYEDYTTDEISAFFNEKENKKEENNKKILQAEERNNIIDSIYKKRAIFINDTILPIFDNFKIYLNNKDIICEIDNDWKDGVNIISVYIKCRNDEHYGKHELIFVFDYSFKTNNNCTEAKLEFVDEIEFIEKSGWEPPPGTVNFSDLLNENKPKDKIKFDDVNEKIILNKLFNWFNELVKENIVE